MGNVKFKKCVKLIKAIEKLKKENKSLKRSNELLEEQLKRALSEKSEDPVAKKIRLTENDPFKVLNEYCIREILKHIEDGFDFYQMTKISKLWKSFAEDDERAADKVKKIQTLNISSYDEVLEIASETRDIRYKHVSINTGFCYYEFSLPLERFVTPELETLSVKSSFIEWALIQPTKYPALQKLHLSVEYDEYGLSELNWLTASEFPILTDLTCIQLSEDENFHGTEICLDSMPKLKRLHFDYGGCKFSFNQEDLTDPPFHLESLTCRSYPEEFCQSQAGTLKKLKCNFLDFSIFEKMLVTLNNLESMTIAIEHFRNYEHQAQFPLARNYSITNLGYSRDCNTDTLSQVLMSLPALETLTIYYELTEYILSTAARVNLKLKKIVCKWKTVNLVKFYENLKKIEANNEEFNKDIKIVVNSKLQWDLLIIGDDSDNENKYYREESSDEN